jgi:hypothetical protein
MNFSQIRPVIKTLMVLTLMLVSALAWAAEKNAPGDKVAWIFSSSGQRRVDNRYPICKWLR